MSIFMYVCMYNLCKYKYVCLVYMHVCMYVCIDVCKYVCMYLCTYYICIHGWISEYM